MRYAILTVRMADDENHTSIGEAMVVAGYQLQNAYDLGDLRVYDDDGNLWVTFMAETTQEMMQA